MIITASSLNFASIITPPNGLEGVCLLAPSGQFDSTRPKALECALYRELGEVLASEGFATFLPLTPRRDDVNLPATAQEIETRVASLRTALDDIAMTGNDGMPIICVGFSLGAVSLLRAACQYPLPAATPRGLLLVGCVVEEPLPLLFDCSEIRLIYGEHDLIEYEDQSGQVGVVYRPEEYGKLTAANILVRRSQRVSLEIWESCGHLLVRDVAKVREVALALANSILSISSKGNS